MSASARAGRLWGTAAAAALLAAAGLAALLGGGGTERETEARFSGALRALSALPGPEARLILGLDPEPHAPEAAAGDPLDEVAIEEILEAMEHLSPPASGIPWDDEPIHWLVEDLDESEAARLALELARENG